MSAILLSRILSAIVILGGAMALGHVMLPYSPGHGLDRRVLFYAFVAAIGFARGLRDATVRGGFSPKARRIRAAVFAVVGVACSVAGYWVGHGNPLR